MKFYQIFTWFKRNLLNISLPHRKMIATFVYGLLNSRRIGVASIGRGMKTKTTARYNIKRVARFLANDKFNVTDSLLKLQKILCSKAKLLYIVIDWTTITNFGYKVLKATIIGEGRGIPIAFKTYKEGTIKNKETHYEKELLKHLRIIISKEIKVVIIADRGFGRKSELANYIKKIGFNYVMRTKEDISIECEDFTGKIKDFKTITERMYELKNVIWPKLIKKSKEIRKNRIKSRFIITKKKGCLERWVLITDIDNMPAETIVKIYYKRMTIEETFRDEKNILNGFAFEKMKLSSAQRYDKMLVIISYTYLLIMLFGLFMEQKNMHRKIMANTVKYRSLSLLQVGLYYYNDYDISIPKLLKLITDLIFQI